MTIEETSLKIRNRKLLFVAKLFRATTFDPDLKKKSRKF